MTRLPICRIFACSLALVSVFFFACNKKDPFPNTSTYTFTNNLNADVTLDVYENEDDYYHSRNPVKSVAIPVGIAQPIELEALRTYWLDWYNSTYIYNNWATYSGSTQAMAAFPAPKISIARQPDKIGINGNADISRSVLFKGNQYSSNWRLNISDFPALNGTHTFTFRRDYSGEHRHTRPSGDVTTTTIRLQLAQVSLSTFRLLLYDKDNNQEQLADVYYYPSIDPNSTNSTDTLMVNFRTPGYYSYVSAWRQ